MEIIICKPIITEQVAALAEIALAAHLYHCDWWAMIGTLTNLKERRYLARYNALALVKDGDLPVAVATIRDTETFSVFVKEEYRRRGIATELFKILSMNEPKLRRGNGVDGSEKFFDSVGFKGYIYEQKEVALP